MQDRETQREEEIARLTQQRDEERAEKQAALAEVERLATALRQAAHMKSIRGARAVVRDALGDDTLA